MHKVPRLAGLAIAAVLATTACTTLGARTGWTQDTGTAAEAAIPVSKSLKIDGLVQSPKTYNLKQLKAEPATTETVFYSTGAGPVSATFKGVLLWTLLQEAGIKTDPAVKNDILRRSALVTATDGYQALLSLGEVSPGFGGELAIIAYEQDGKPLGSEGGFARLVVPGDKVGGRYVSSVTRIEVK